MGSIFLQEQGINVFMNFTDDFLTGEGDGKGKV